MSTGTDPQHLFEYLLRLGDDALVLGQRLGEWCGHGPYLEEDIALTNFALDFIGQARLLLGYAGEIEGRGRDEDALAFFRDSMEYRNVLLVEQPNRDFGYTIVRQLLVDAWQAELHERLSGSSDRRLAEIAAKSLKETRYHLRHSARWTVRLGDGTDESHARVQQALDELWMWTGELFEGDDLDRAMAAAGIGVDPGALRPAWDQYIGAVLAEATLERPAPQWMQGGGRRGHHTEHLGYLLAEMQSVPRAHPDARAW